MSNFILTDFSSGTKQKILKLCRDGRCFYDRFVKTVKADGNLAPELSDLWAIMRDVANGLQVPTKLYRKEHLGKKLPFAVYAVKSTNLRLYTFTDADGMIVIIGGKKTEQDEDLERAKDIVKEYAQFIKNKI